MSEPARQAVGRLNTENSADSAEPVISATEPTIKEHIINGTVRLMSAGAAHFGPELFDFLRELKENNRRDWFLANRQRYNAHVLEPLLRFVADLSMRLDEISPHLVADPRPVGGSILRIHRDTRFSKDKSPYKTWVAAQFRHAMGRDVHAPALYLHLEPGRVFAGSGLWHPDPTTLGKLRAAIVERPDGWEDAISGEPFRARWTLAGDSLKRPPIGFDPNHPFVEDLKRKDFVAVSPFSEDEVCAPAFLDRYVEACQAAAPFMGFLAAALDLPW